MPVKVPLKSSSCASLLTGTQKEAAQTRHTKHCAAYQVVENLGRRPCAIAAGYKALQNPPDTLNVALNFLL